MGWLLPGHEPRLQGGAASVGGVVQCTVWCWQRPCFFFVILPVCRVSSGGRVRDSGGRSELRNFQMSVTWKLDHACLEMC